MQQKIKQSPHVLTHRTVMAILCICQKGETNTNSLEKTIGITSSHAYKKIVPKLVT